jgi:hypothetical protein
MPRQLKDPSVRQRRNKAPSRADLRPLQPDEIDIPALPQLFDSDGNAMLWSHHTVRWWERIWSSPMAPEFHKSSDIEGLYRMARAHEDFWSPKSSASMRLAAMAELRHWETQFGLNPLARRRLEWTIVGAEKAQEEADARAERKASKAPKPTAVPDGTAAAVDPLSA